MDLCHGKVTTFSNEQENNLAKKIKKIKSLEILDKLKSFKFSKYRLFKKNNAPNIIENYLIKNTIGVGSFGKVKLAVYIPTNEKFAIKIIEKTKIKEKDDLIRLQREFEMSSKFNHPNLIKVKEIFENNDYYFTVMEYCEDGELFSYMKKNKILSEDEASFFYYQLIEGLEYIHSLGISHRDLKPENILLTKEHILKIIDFGLSNYYIKENDTLLTTLCGSPYYVSPEIIKGEKYNGDMVDIWNSGVILYFMLCGYLPFNDEIKSEMFKKIVQCKVDYPKSLSTIAIDLLKKILTPDPHERIKITDIKKHPFYLKEKIIFEECFFIEYFEDEKSNNNIKNLHDIKDKENKNKIINNSPIKLDIDNNFSYNVNEEKILLKKINEKKYDYENDIIKEMKNNLTNNDNIKNNSNNRIVKTNKNNNKNQNKTSKEKNKKIAIKIQKEKKLYLKHKLNPKADNKKKYYLDNYNLKKTINYKNKTNSFSPKKELNLQKPIKDIKALKKSNFINKILKNSKDSNSKDKSLKSFPISLNKILNKTVEERIIGKDKNYKKIINNLENINHKKLHKESSLKVNNISNHKNNVTLNSYYRKVDNIKNRGLIYKNIRSKILKHNLNYNKKTMILSNSNSSRIHTIPNNIDNNIKKKNLNIYITNISAFNNNINIPSEKRNSLTNKISKNSIMRLNMTWTPFEISNLISSNNHVINFSISKKNINLKKKREVDKLNEKKNAKNKIKKIDKTNKLNKISSIYNKNNIIRNIRTNRFYNDNDNKTNYFPSNKEKYELRNKNNLINNENTNKINSFYNTLSNSKGKIISKKKKKIFFVVEKRKLSHKTKVIKYNKTKCRTSKELKINKIIKIKNNANKISEK